MKKHLPLILCGIIVLSLFLVVLFWASDNIGTPADKLEADIRQSQKIDDSWTVTGEVSDAMAAYISYPEDMSDFTFSVYVKHTGLSFGYFFRAGGSIYEIEDSILACKAEGCNEQAFISMNKHKTVRLEINNGLEIKKQIDAIRDKVVTGTRAGTVSAEKKNVYNWTQAELEVIKRVLAEKNPNDGNAAFAVIKAEFDKLTKQLKTDADKAGKKLSNAFIFCEDVFAEGQEMLILVTELTISYYGAHFISRYGCKEYFNHNKELLFYERQKEIIGQLEKLELEV